jgi:uncharacterized protein (TIGR02118 family)
MRFPLIVGGRCAGTRSDMTILRAAATIADIVARSFAGKLPDATVFIPPHHRRNRTSDRRKPMIKSIGLLTRKAELTHEQFVRHWIEIHAPLAHALPGVRRYVQNHIIEERTRADIPATEVAIDGVAELWYDDRAAMDRANASPEAKRLHDDGALFIGRIKSFVVEEKVIIPPGG